MEVEQAMSQSTALYSKSLSAQDLLMAFGAISQKWAPGQPFEFHLATNVAGFHFSVSSPPETFLSHKIVLKFLDSIKDRSIVVAVRGHIRRASNPQGSVNYKCEDGVIGTWTLDVQNDPELAPPLLAAVEASVHLTTYLDIVGKSSSELDKAALAIRERSVADLNEAVQRLAVFLTRLAEDEVRRRRELEESLETAYHEKRDELELTDRRRTDAFEERKRQWEDELAKKQQAFQERVSEFETRESKHMRRALLKEIKDVLKESERVTLSESTDSKRWWVHGTVWGGALVTTGVAGLMAYKLFTEAAFDWHILLALSASFFAFIAMMVYYLRWNDLWFRQHADAEFAARRYKADILRASWIAELLNEWAKEGKGDLPADLLAAYTRGLFLDASPSRPVDHPLDHMTSLMRRATEISFGKTGVRVKGHDPRQSGG
ncbi:MAG: hypothetical protein IT434_16585 [Phycisphaerales bacterium]|nr:hypothetical protein [Phycisphaerales bacterium]